MTFPKPKNYVKIHKSDNYALTLADLGGACPTHAHSMGPNSFIFTYIFIKSGRIGGPHLPNESTTPYGKFWIRHWLTSDFATLSFPSHAGKATFNKCTFTNWVRVEPLRNKMESVANIHKHHAKENPVIFRECQFSQKVYVDMKAVVRQLVIHKV